MTKSGMEIKAAGFISWILHPMLIPTYAILIILSQQTLFVMILPERLKLVLTAMVVSNTLIIPLIFVWIMRRKGIITSYQMPYRHERTFPFITTALFYSATWFMMNNLGLPAVFYLFVLGGALLILLSLIVNFFWKISVHMVGIGGVTGGFIGLNYQLMVNSVALILILVLLSGLVGFSRLRLNTHNPSQVYAGYLAGVGMMLGIALYL